MREIEGEMPRQGIGSENIYHATYLSYIAAAINKVLATIMIYLIGFKKVGESWHLRRHSQAL